jgi:hypothetical protein
MLVLKWKYSRLYTRLNTLQRDNNQLKMQVLQRHSVACLWRVCGQLLQHVALVVIHDDIRTG